MNRVLVVGSWAKEQITIENLAARGRCACYSYMDTENPGIKRLVEGFRTGELKDSASIADYAASVSADLVVITTASPLASGTVDILRKKGIRAFGPTSSAARLEYDKAFARDLLLKYCPKAVPCFGVFDNAQEAIDFAKSHDWQVAVKYIGLAEGLGVKVFGDQLIDENHVQAYIREVLESDKSGIARVMVEERIDGEEFTLQCLVKNKSIIPTPCVQDFKKLLPGDKGPNTASMGSYNDNNILLPFLSEDDYRCALEIIKSATDGFYDYTGGYCEGFLYGQFMLTSKGIKLVEFNFRPGDPEWINTMLTFEGSLCEVIDGLNTGNAYKWQFSNKASVCKYIVPKGYPEKLDSVLPVSFDEELIRSTGARLYYSCGRGRDGMLYPGSERGIAIAASAGTIEEAYEITEKAVSLIKGEFAYRGDIGSEAQIKEKRKRTAVIRGLS